MEDTETHALDLPADGKPFVPSRFQWEQLQGFLRNNEHPASSSSASQIEALSIQDLSDAAKNEPAEVSVEHYLAGYKSLHAPIRKLPAECLQNIFFFISERIDLGEPGPQSVENIPCLCVTHVCAHWRKSAHGYPTLWTNLVVIFTDSEPKLRRTTSTSLHVQLLAHFLELSRNRPLSIMWMERDDLSPDSLEARRDMMHQLAQHSNRWRQVGIAIFQDVEETTKSLLDKKFPSLENLVLTTNIPHFHLPGFSNAPKLETAVIAGLNLDTLELPWSQLCDLNISNYSPSEMIRVFPQLTNLSELVLANVLNEVGEDIDPRDWMSLTLKEWNILSDWSNEDFVGLNAILRQGSAPSLKDLVLACGARSEHQATTSFLPALSDFVERSASRLTSVRLVAVPVPLDELITFLRVLPHLTLLAFEPKRNEYDTRLFSALTWSDFVPDSDLEDQSHPLQNMLLPCLKGVHFSLPSIDKAGVDLLGRMMKSRWKSHPDRKRGRLTHAQLELGMPLVDFMDFYDMLTAERPRTLHLVVVPLEEEDEKDVEI